jgi:alanyl aminopeptidase
MKDREFKAAKNEKEQIMFKQSNFDMTGRVGIRLLVNPRLMKTRIHLPWHNINRVYAAISALLLSVVSLAQAGSDTPTPPKLRLGDDARPSACAVELWVLPEQDHFTGEVTIDLEFARSTGFLWLHGHGLAVTNAWLLQQGRRFNATPIRGGEEFLGFAFELPAKRGKAQLHVSYQGAMSDRDLTGLFRRKEADSWYAATQMEATYARRVFPCFDEPAFKVPWRLALHVKREHVAVANTPALPETMEPGGMKCVRFAVSKPLPSYLVAFGVGPFELVDLGKIGRNHTPVRIITTRGRTSETACAAKTIPEILRRLEDYYGMPYPYEKLDHLAIPQFGGAMENAGLIIYGDTTILSPPDRQTIWFERGVASICAHEMAHEWFGDLVTMAWWDDLWLNEAFASWMDPKIVNSWKPEWRLDLDQAQAMGDAASADSLVSSRRIRQPIESAPDIENAFDAITYTKGAAVLGMFESWVGREKFQKGVHAYLLNHAWKNAAAADFLNALDRAAKSDVASAFSTFLDQPGIPLVSVEALHDLGAAPSLQLSQKRYFPVGSAGETKCTWHIPMRGRYVVGGREEPFQRLLVKPLETVRFKASEGSVQ